jgi:hypothetical protein
MVPCQVDELRVTGGEVLGGLLELREEDRAVKASGRRFRQHRRVRHA